MCTRSSRRRPWVNRFTCAIAFESLVCFQTKTLKFEPVRLFHTSEWLLSDLIAHPCMLIARLHAFRLVKFCDSSPAVCVCGERVTRCLPAQLFYSYCLPAATPACPVASRVHPGYTLRPHPSSCNRLALPRSIRRPHPPCPPPSPTCSSPRGAPS